VIKFRMLDMYSYKVHKAKTLIDDEHRFKTARSGQYYIVGYFLLSLRHLLLTITWSTGSGHAIMERFLRLSICHRRTKQSLFRMVSSLTPYDLSFPQYRFPAMSPMPNYFGPIVCLSTVRHFVKKHRSQ